MGQVGEAERRGPAWLVQAALIARRFYLEGRSKVEIADELGLSRFKVARILEDAHGLGLIEVRVQLPAHIDPELSAAVREHYGLRRAVVVERPADEGSSVRATLGRLAADLLTELVGPDDVLGLTCSRTVAATTQALRSLAPCHVVQLTGTLAGPDQAAGSVESVRQAAVVGGGKAFPIYAPMILPDAATARALSGESAIQQAIGQFPDVSIAMVAVGSWEAELSTAWEAVEPSERKRATEAGAVGEIGARLFDAHGQPVRSSIDARVLGVSLEQLRRIPEVIGLAYDSRRADAVRAALVSGVVDTLVCDADLGRSLLPPTAKQPQRGGVSA